VGGAVEFRSPAALAGLQFLALAWVCHSQIPAGHHADALSRAAGPAVAMIGGRAVVAGERSGASIPAPVPESSTAQAASTTWPDVDAVMCHLGLPTGTRHRRGPEQLKRRPACVRTVHPSCILAGSVMPHSRGQQTRRRPGEHRACRRRLGDPGNSAGMPCTGPRSPDRPHLPQPAPRARPPYSSCRLRHRELTAAQADDLYELIAEWAGHSLVLTSSRARLVGWYPLFPNPVVAESLVNGPINTSH
jgi:hypothetical protein